jgi:DNA (cytosine-5)-methyltransferase 1
VDARCKFAFERNNGGTFYARDVSKLLASEIKAHFSGTAPSVLAGCAPCQPFSSYKHRYGEDPQWSLVTKFAELAAEVRPDFVTMENVPALLKYKSGEVFQAFTEALENADYKVRHVVAKCEQFGVPQRRRRLVVLACLGDQVPNLMPSDSGYRSVRDAISSLPVIESGGRDPSDSLHTAAKLSDLNVKRIRHSKPGGTWKDWPVSLRAACHRRPSGRTYPGVYARMAWDSPAPTMTTQCYGYGNGRFGHPDQDRGISLREAALLQSFPPEYEFLPTGEAVNFKEVGRWIGNAVPVKLAESIGDAIVASARARNGEAQS